MKTPFFLILYAGVTVIAAVNAQKAFRPAHLPANDPAFDNTPFVITDEDLKDPPPGEVRKLYVAYLKETRSILAANLAAAPEGPEGRQSPWMAKFQGIIASMDQIVVSCSQRHVIELIPRMKEVFEAGGTEGYSPFFAAQGGLIRSAGVCVLHAIAEHVTDQEANVAAAELAHFVTVFSVSGFIFTPDWESELMPIDAAGVMILDSAAVVTQLKALPWKRAQQFLGRYSAAEAFEDYEAAGTGLPSLKAKYAANKATILAKWQELQTWVSQQKAAK